MCKMSMVQQSDERASSSFPASTECTSECCCRPCAVVGPDAPGLTCLGDHLRTVFVAETLLPTTSGAFRVRAYRSTGSLRESEPIAFVSGDIRGKKRVIVRVHDQCFTSEVFGSLKCDCREQLEYAKEYTRVHDGVVIYMPQEGRGIGLANKIKAYALQERGFDTVDANRLLGFDDDYRSYEPVKFILDDLGIQSVCLLTNNPRKIRMLQNLSIHVEKRLPVIIKGGEFSRHYLHTKALRMDHLYDKSDIIASDDDEDDEQNQGARPQVIGKVKRTGQQHFEAALDDEEDDREDTATDESQDELEERTRQLHLV